MKKVKTLIGLFLTALSLFFYELLVSRIFSVLLPNHYSYLVISFAISGLGIGGIVVYYFIKNRLFNCNYFIVVYVITYFLTITIYFVAPYLGSPIWYVVLGMLPFIFGGGIIAYLFKKHTDTFQIYFTDLLGGVTGLIGAILLMSYLGTLQAIIISYLILPFIVLFLYSGKAKYPSVVILLVVFILGYNGIVSLYQNNFNGFLTSPYVGYKEEGEHVYSSWDSFARTDVFWNEEDPEEMLMGLNGRSFSMIYKYDGDLSKIQYLKNKIGYLPLETGSPESIAIIGSGGGEEILYSFLAGANNITAVEINPHSILAVRELADFTGNVYDDPRVKTVIGDGRSFIRKTTEKFDQIYLGLVMTNVGDSVANTLSENYIYTREALDNYVTRLNPDGQVNFLLHSTNDLLKLLTTSISYFENKGIPNEEIPDHFIIVGYRHSSMYPLVIIKPEPFTLKEVTEIKRKIEEKGFRAVHLPFIGEEHLLHLYKAGGISIPEMVNAFHFNVEPVTDDRPFFYNIHKGIPRNLLAILIGSLGILFLAYFSAVYQIRKRPIIKPFTNHFGIFVTLGMAFMLLEISLIQKMSVFLEHPTTSFVVIITALLSGAGIGNLLQSRKRVFDNYKPLFFLVGLSTVILMLTNRIIYLETFGYLWQKILMVVLLLFPLGFLMGIPFPLILKRLQDSKYKDWVPFFWGVNGVGSVLGSALTLILALEVGFNITFMVGVILYAIAGLLMKSEMSMV